MSGGGAASVPVSVVVPVKDEAGNVAPLAREIAAALKSTPHEILFVDDGSTDGTAAALTALKGEIPELRVLRHSRNLGQSRGIRTGVAAAILLAALGAHRDDIFDDYLISANVYAEHAETLYYSMQFSSFGASFEIARDILIVHEEYLDAAWNEIRNTFGGIDDFIKVKLGLSDETRQQLREMYTAEGQ